MVDWHFWLGAALLLVIAELMTNTFYLLMVALGALAGAVLAWLGTPILPQALVAAVVAALGVAWVNRRRRRQGAAVADAGLDVGATLRIDHWHDKQARVRYRGAPWDVELAPGAEARAGEFRITDIRGNRLVVTNN